MVAGDGVDHFCGLPIALGDVGAQHGVRPLFLVADSLPDVVEERPSFGECHVQPQLCRHRPADIGGLSGMVQIVLSVTGPVLQPPQDLHELGVEIRQTEFKDDLLRFFDHEFINVGFHLLDDFFDARRVNPPIVHQPFQRDLGYFSTEGIEARENHRLRRLVNNQIYARRSLECPDIAPLAPDDSALHGVVGNWKHGDRGLRHIVSGDTLNGPGNNLTCFPLCALLRFVNDTLRAPSGFQPSLALDLRDELSFRVFDRQTCYAFQRLPVLLDRPVAGSL